ncbi:MAG: HAD family hydrolase [Chthoniobacterales bacterium]
MLRTHYLLRTMPIEAVIFDLDDTLIVDEAISREAFEETAIQASKYGARQEAFITDAMRIAREDWAKSPQVDYCRSIGISAFECLWGNFDGEADPLPMLKAWSAKFRVDIFDKALRVQGIETPEAGNVLSKVFMDSRRKFARLMSNAMEIIVELSAKYSLGLLTNGAPAFQRDKFKASGLTEYFKAVAISGDHGIGKPDAKIFHWLLDQLGVKPESAVMVGNSVERDILGAHRAGIKSVWIEVSGSEEHADAKPDYVIKDLSELPALLEKIS